MKTRIVKQAEDSGDIMGVVAFGSLVANIFQIVSRKSLEEKHEALRAYAGELKRHYDNMIIRERLVYNENIQLKNANRDLQNLNSRLLKELIEARNETLSLKIATTSTPIKRRVIHKTVGGSK
jgi:hypothetical protein